MHVDVIFEVSQLQRHTFELTAGYYPSSKRILKAIEGKKHSTPRDHKIGIAVKKDCQVTISPLLQHMLGFKQAISRSRRYQRSRFSVRVLPTGRTVDDGRRSSTTFENRTGVTYSFFPHTHFSPRKMSIYSVFPPEK